MADRKIFFDGDYFIDNQGLALVTNGPNQTEIAIDKVGFASGNNSDFNFVEGSPISSYSSPATGEYSFVRRYGSNGRPIDSNNNANDFIAVSTSGTAVGSVPTILGAPGPQNAESATARPGQPLLVSLLDGARAFNALPNRERRTEAVQNGDLGTLVIRRSLTNNTGSPITQIKLRVTDLTTKTSISVSPQTSDARVLNAQGARVRLSNGQEVTVVGTELEAPDQPQGGGVNSALLVQTITLGSPLRSGETVSVEFRFGVVKGGIFRFAAVVETLPGVKQ